MSLTSFHSLGFMPSQLLGIGFGRFSRPHHSVLPHHLPRLTVSPVFLQGDPHPGNMMRTPDGRLAILDFGLMTQIDSNIKYGMIEAISHLIHRDYEAIVEDFVTLDFIPKGLSSHLYLLIVPDNDGVACMVQRRRLPLRDIQFSQ